MVTLYGDLMDTTSGSAAELIEYQKDALILILVLSHILLLCKFVIGECDVKVRRVEWPTH